MCQRWSNRQGCTLSANQVSVMTVLRWATGKTTIPSLILAVALLQTRIGMMHSRHGGLTPLCGLLVQGQIHGWQVRHGCFEDPRPVSKHTRRQCSPDCKKRRVVLLVGSSHESYSEWRSSAQQTTSSSRLRIQELPLTFTEPVAAHRLEGSRDGLASTGDGCSGCRRARGRVVLLSFARLGRAWLGLGEAGDAQPVAPVSEGCSAFQTVTARVVEAAGEETGGM
jgi:hypothetical protein